MESSTLRIVWSDYQGWEKTQEDMKVFLKPQVYLFSLWKHEERENTKESGGSVIKDIMYFFQENKILQMQFSFCF